MSDFEFDIIYLILYLYSITHVFTAMINNFYCSNRAEITSTSHNRRIRRDSGQDTTAKQVYYSSEWFTTVLLSAPGIQRSYLTFYPVAAISLSLIAAVRLDSPERVRILFFNYIHAKGLRGGGGRFGSFHKSRLAHSFS